jgi:pyrimidine-specific ribonucleoside hydrolase
LQPLIYRVPVTRALLLDCDPGIDDMVALLFACTSPEFDLRAVTTVGGNVGIAATTRNARAILALAGRSDVPVAAGAPRSLIRATARHAEGVHGENGLGGVELPESERAVDPRHAVDLLAATIDASTEPVTLVATGPLTNVALLFIRYPETAARLDRLVVMGGSIGAGNVTPAAEFNIWFDPEAAHRVLTDPGLPAVVPTTVVALDLTLRTALEPGHLGVLRSAGRVGGLLAEALAHYQHGYEPLLGRPVVPVHDAVAVAAVARPDLFTLRSARIDVDTGYGPSRGSTLVELSPEVPTVDTAVDADVAAVIGLILERVTSLR